MFADVKSCGFMTRSTQVLSSLQERLGINTLMVSRLVGDDFVVVNAVDRTGYTKVGAWTKWSDSLCSRVVSGDAPDFAPCCSKIDGFRDIVANRKETIAAFLSAPISDRDGSLVGTLCATHDQPLPDRVTDHRVAFYSAAHELGALYSIELDRQKDVRRLLVSSVSRTGKTRGVLDSAAWSIVTRVEEARHNVLRHPVAFGAARVCSCHSESAARRLTQVLGPTDVMTSFGQGQFLFMLSHVEDLAMSSQEEKIYQMLEQASIPADVKLVMHRTTEFFATSMAKATQSVRQPACDECAA